MGSHLKRNEIRTHINEHDNAIKHLTLEQKTEYAKIGAMPTDQIQKLCAENEIPTSSNIHSLPMLRNKLRFRAGLLPSDPHTKPPSTRQNLQEKAKFRGLPIKKPKGQYFTNKELQSQISAYDAQNANTNTRTHTHTHPCTQA